MYTVNIGTVLFNVYNHFYFVVNISCATILLCKTDDSFSDLVKTCR